MFPVLYVKYKTCVKVWMNVELDEKKRMLSS